MGTYYDPQWIATAKTLGWRRGAASKVEALKAGLDGGINFIDTAEIYGSEELVARAIVGRKREDLFIATKVWSNHLRRDALVKALEKSLKRLGTSYVDLYQVHFPNTKVPIAETMGAMEEMKDKGKLLSIGVSNFSLKQTIDANAALKKSQLASNQVDYSLANREIEADLLPYCESNKITIIAYYPLGHGKLTGPGARAKMERGVQRALEDPRAGRAELARLGEERLRDPPGVEGGARAGEPRRQRLGAEPGGEEAARRGVPKVGPRVLVRLRETRLPGICSEDQSRRLVPHHSFTRQAEPAEPRRPSGSSRRCRPYPRPACTKGTSAGALRFPLARSHTSGIFGTCLSG